jgi:hypothetical protein
MNTIDEQLRPTKNNRRHHNLRQKQFRRRTEDVDYWRHRAGWYDDDKAMLEYNNGVYDAYYQLDDDKTKGTGGGRLSSSNFDVTKVLIRVLCAVLVIGVCIFMYRVVSRRFSGSSEDTKEKRKRSSSRERSSSRSRSRSRSRKSGSGTGDYDLMSEDEDGKSSRSKGSNRSRSKSGRSSSRTRTRSRSTSRKDSSKASPSTAAEPVLV